MCLSKPGRMSGSAEHVVDPDPDHLDIILALDAFPFLPTASHFLTAACDNNDLVIAYFNLEKHEMNIASAIVVGALTAAVPMLAGVPTPEIDSSTAAAAIGLVGGAILLIRSRRKR
jgi:hypothetical protein